MDIDSCKKRHLTVPVRSTGLHETMFPLCVERVFLGEQFHERVPSNQVRLCSHASEGSNSAAKKAAEGERREF